jgi:predicted metallopeptidase
LVKRAKAFAPILWAFPGAFSTPPEALTWAPTYFIEEVFPKLNKIEYL